MTSLSETTSSTLNVLIAALGGEGGGVLTQWLLDIAERANWHCQSTSLAGVAQRTGATIYYLEFIPKKGDGGKAPVMSLFPSQGDIDLAVTSELVEAGRMMSRGFISPDRTTLVSSSHRVYGIDEKTAVTDGTADTQVIESLADAYAKRLVKFDIDEVVRRQGTVISAGLLGAIAGSSALPFDIALYREVISAGNNAAANLAAFDECFARASKPAVEHFELAVTPAFELPNPTTSTGREILPRIAALPVELHEVVYHGVLRLIDYQDADYARTYLTRVETLLEAHPGYLETSKSSARWLALWMAYEDIPRVAQLKLRPARFDAIRDEVRAAPDQLLQVTEFFHPRIEEVAALLPVSLGRFVLRSGLTRKFISLFLGPRQLRTDALVMRSVFHLLAGSRKMRRRTLGYAHEHAMIERWMAAVSGASAAVSAALADCGRLVKGYGATRHRTTSQLMMIIDASDEVAGITPEQIRNLFDAALDVSDEQRFERELAGVRASTQ